VGGFEVSPGDASLASQTRLLSAGQREGENSHAFKDFLTENGSRQNQNSALTGLFVPKSTAMRQKAESAVSFSRQEAGSLLPEDPHPCILNPRPLMLIPESKTLNLEFSTPHPDT